MSKSVFAEELNRSFKQKRLNDLSSSDKKKYRLETIEQLFLELGDKKNRFVFYCPDIVVVNHIVKAIYDIAYSLHSLHYNVVLLHEFKGFKCKWILENENFSHYKELKTDYIIEKKGKKSKKEKNQYSFKPTDTLIVSDVFQDVLENLKNVPLLQKVVLVTSYSGISNLIPGSNYKHLDVSSLIFLQEKVKEDYEKIFPETKNNFLINFDFVNYKIFNTSQIDAKNVYPVIGITRIGTEKLTQQITNIFYNKFPNLQVFSFKIIDRTSYEDYIESLKHCCLYLNLDETLGFKQPLLEALKLGIPTASFERRELLDNQELCENVVLGKKDAFEIADFLGEYCSYWLTKSNKKIINNFTVRNSIEEFNENSFKSNIERVFEELHQNRIKFFSSIKKSIDKSEVDES